MSGYELSSYDSIRPMAGARSNPVFNVTRARKKAEQDSILLANRIRLLRAEDARTRKKIVETEKKTQEILCARQRKEQQRHEKEVFEAQKEVMDHDFRTRQMVERIDQQHKIQDKMRQIQQKNALGGNALRQQRYAHRQILDLEKQASHDEAFARAEQVRVAMDRAAHSRARSEGAKQELAKDVVRERMLREEDERRLKLQEIDRMEREEAELLQRLRLSQERHRMAYMQLEDVIRGQVTSLESSSPVVLPPFSQPWDHQTATPSSSRRNAESPASRPNSGTGLERVERVERLVLSKPPLPRAPPGARPRSGHRGAQVKPSTPPDAVDQLRNMHSKSAMSNASTTSVGETSIVLEGAYEGSAQSTSSSAPQIRYTTVDGVQLDIPAEEDLDLAAILNGR